MAEDGQKMLHILTSAMRHDGAVPEDRKEALTVYVSSPVGQAIDSMRALSISAKPIIGSLYDSVDRLLLGSFPHAYDSLPGYYRLSRTYMTTPLAPCKQARTGKTIGSRCPQASSNVM